MKPLDKFSTSNAASRRRGLPQKTTSCCKFEVSLFVSCSENFPSLVAIAGYRAWLQYGPLDEHPLPSLPEARERHYTT